MDINLSISEQKYIYCKSTMFHIDETYKKLEKLLQEQSKKKTYNHIMSRDVKSIMRSNGTKKDQDTGSVDVKCINLLQAYFPEFVKKEINDIFGKIIYARFKHIDDVNLYVAYDNYSMKFLIDLVNLNHYSIFTRESFVTIISLFFGLLDYGDYTNKDLMIIVDLIEFACDKYLMPFTTILPKLKGKKIPQPVQDMLIKCAFEKELHFNTILPYVTNDMFLEPILEKCILSPLEIDFNFNLLINSIQDKELKFKVVTWYNYKYKGLLTMQTLMGSKKVCTPIQKKFLK